MFALLHAAARLDGLLKGQPRLRGETVGDDRAPQDQDVDAGIIARGERIAREAGAGSAGLSPRLDPWDAARLEFGDDAGGHLVIEIGARFGLGGRFSVLGHGLNSIPPQKPHGPPRKAGDGRHRATREVRLSGRRHRQGAAKRSTPSASEGLRPAAAGLAGSAARTRLTGRGHTTRLRSSLRRQGRAEARPRQSDRYRRPRP